MYSHYKLYELLSTLPEVNPFNHILNRLDKVRYEDIEYCSELYFSLAEGKVVDSNKSQLDVLYKKYFIDNAMDDELMEGVKEAFIETASILDTLIKDMQLYYKNSVSHLYAMWMFAYYLFTEDKDVNLYKKCFLEFYTKVKQKETNPYIQKYIQSMQQSTKSIGSRKKRFEALLGYMKENVEK